jgi:hypothetical protein
MKSTQAMRDRCRELSKPDRDDYDRAVICILDDLEALEAALQSAQNTLTAVEILLKNQDRREHEEKVYDAVRACAGIVRVALEKDTGAHE